MRYPHGMTGPFAWDPVDGTPLGHLVRRRVIQCALSRICGVCAEPLGRPVVFVGTPEEVGRNAFHLPPLHSECAHGLADLPGADDTWEVVATAGFEFVRPTRGDVDQAVRFEPNSVLS